MPEPVQTAPAVAELLRSVEAGDLDAVKAAVEKDSSIVNGQDGSGRTALHFAAWGGQVPIATYLVEKGATIQQPDFDHLTPLLLAAKKGQKGMVEYLVSAGADINYKTPTGATALHQAAVTGEVATLHVLVAQGATLSSEACETGSPLHWACHDGDIPAASFFLDWMDVSVDIQDSNQGTALIGAVGREKLDITTFLLERGANPNHAARGGATPLHILCELGDNAEICKQLLGFGASIDIKDAEGNTALQIAEEKKRTLILKEFKRKQAGQYDYNDTKREAQMTKFKTQGNKVFAAGEYAKAAKFYTLAIQYNRNNHVLFSNRSATFYNSRRYKQALADGCHCVKLNPKWPKGYFRKGACLVALEHWDKAKDTLQAGLKLDPNNADLKNQMKELEEKLKKRAEKAASE
eukprot:TRINITY_DN75198_c0_g1_i1.p2 TRINITY_DN75198_c0_g1~~TRINITY_DN75198_c0_g1_i1.p2  ORF type:complete len:408 (+),score=59.07 TRINITY_DN75198_c0_g1_i1:55-1278(+)